MSFRRVLITGISGSGGSYLAEYVADNHPESEIHGISRWHSTSSKKNLERIADKVQMHECDLTDMSSVISSLRETKPEAIFHIASHANVRASFTNPLAVIQNNIMGTANLLEALRIEGMNSRVQICSTSEVYGQVDSKNVPIKEDCPINPSNPYAVSKVAQDLLGGVYHRSYQMDIVRTRMFSYLSPRRSDLFSTSFALQVARIEQGLQKELIHGNLDSTRTIIDVRDAMESYWVAIEKGRSGEVYNIGGDKIITVGEFLHLLRKNAKCEIPCRQDQSLMRPSDVTLQIPDVSKFRNETGWKPKYSFEESVDYLLNHSRKEVEREIK